MTKKEWLASEIVRACQWLSARSVKLRLLIDAVVEQLFISKQMVLPPVVPRFTPDELAANTEAYNEASERYFAEYKDRAYLLGKPYTDTMNFARRLFDIGVIVHWLRLSPGEVVVELGAGTCWLSHFLNRFGCKTIAIDVSSSALQMGEELFKRDPLTNWELAPEFVTYDGHHIPLPDGHVDKMLVYDAFHHVPNQAEILREMARVLKDGGVVAMCEPGGWPRALRAQQARGRRVGSARERHLRGGAGEARARQRFCPTECRPDQSSRSHQRSRPTGSAIFWPERSSDSTGANGVRRSRM